jgi:hypothetical protein
MIERQLGSGGKVKAELSDTGEQSQLLCMLVKFMLTASAALSTATQHAPQSFQSAYMHRQSVDRCCSSLLRSVCLPLHTRLQQDCGQDGWLLRVRHAQPDPGGLPGACQVSCG